MIEPVSIVWQLIKGYGGGPNTWCNSSAPGPKCGYPNETQVATTHSEARSKAQRCSLQSGVCHPGNDIHSLRVANADACCSACDAESTCGAFTFNTGTVKTKDNCFLKTVLGAKANKSAKCVSGTSGRTPAPPAPKPQPVPPAPEGGKCPNGWCLYDVMTDPYELHEMSTLPANAAILSELKNQMADVLTTYTQYEEDPECQGKATFAHDKVVGKTWQPWC